jgi:hypothetical protein
MNIPTKILVGTKEYSVEIVEALLDKADMGQVNLKHHKVRIAKKSNITGQAFTSAQINDTFWHEVTHAILHDMGSKLYNNEVFVHGFSSRLNNVVLTAKF